MMNRPIVIGAATIAVIVVMMYQFNYDAASSFVIPDLAIASPDAIAMAQVVVPTTCDEWRSNLRMAFVNQTMVDEMCSDISFTLNGTTMAGVQLEGNATIESDNQSSFVEKALS